TVKAKSDPGLAVLEVLDRQIRSVVAVGMSHDVRGFGFETCKKSVERNAFPCRAELRPSRDTVQVDGRSFSWQCAERFPVPSFQKRIVFVADGEFPSIERNVRSRAGRQYGKI